MVAIDEHIVYGRSGDNEVMVQLKEGGCFAEVYKFHLASFRGRGCQGAGKLSKNGFWNVDTLF